MLSTPDPVVDQAPVEIPVIGSVSGGTQPIANAVEQKVEPIVDITQGQPSKSTTASTPTLPSTVTTPTTPTTTPSPTAGESTSSQSESPVPQLTLTPIEDDVVEKESEGAKENRGTSTEGTKKISVSGGTSVEFLNRSVSGSPTKKNEDGKEEPILPESYLRNSVWFDITARPNENVQVTSSITVENPDGFITDPTQMRLGGLTIIAQTESSKFLIGTLESHKKLNSPLLPETNVDGIYVETNGDVFNFEIIAAREHPARYATDDKDTTPGLFARYNVGLTAVTSKLINGWTLQAGANATWDDGGSLTETQANGALPDRRLAARLGAVGTIAGTSVELSGEVQLYTPDTWALVPTSELQLAGSVDLRRTSGNWSFGVGANYAAQGFHNYNESEGESVLLGGDYGVYGNIGYTLDNGSINASARYGAWHRTDKDDNLIQIQGTEASLDAKYGTPIAFGDTRVGSWSVSNTTTYTDTQDVNKPDIYEQSFRNRTQASVSVTPVENWNHQVQAGFTYGSGVKSDEEKGEQQIDQKLINASYSTQYAWKVTDRLNITPRYQFTYQNDLGNTPVNTYEHKGSVDTSYVLVPNQLAAIGDVTVGFKRVLETEIDEDGEPVLGRSNFYRTVQAGLRYTPEWLSGLVIEGTFGKHYANFVQDDIIAIEGKPRVNEDAWIANGSIAYSGVIGQVGTWEANYGIQIINDKTEEYSDIIHKGHLGVTYELSDTTSIKGAYDISMNKKTFTQTGNLDASVDLGPNASLGFRWSLSHEMDLEDYTGNSDKMVNEISGYFRGQF